MKGWVDNGFLRNAGTGRTLVKYLQQLIDTKSAVSAYALRIGGRTWNLTWGLDRQFVDYLGTWKSPEASAPYYRERPSAVLQRLTRFYKNLPNPEEL